jgi:hypothetical protein
MTIATHGGDLAKIWRPDHSRGGGCPECGHDITRVGLPDLAWTFERCECDQVPYAHLTEVAWHRSCLQNAGASSADHAPVYDTPETVEAKFKQAAMIMNAAKHAVSGASGLSGGAR